LGEIQRRYAHAVNPNAVLNQMNVTAGTRATPVPDIIGSIIGSQDSSSGALTKVGYLPYGKSASTGPFGFTGQRIDPEIGAIDPIGNLYYYRARHYSPAWGRFLQPDPIGYAGGANLYAYVSNDPLNGIDPSGLFTFQIGVAAGSSILGIVVPQGGVGFAVDTKGNVGTYAYTGAGLGAGVSAGAGLTLQFSNAPTIYDLQNQFTNSSVSVGPASIDTFTGTAINNSPIVGAGLTVGITAGVSASVTQTSTQVCGPQGCFGSANVLSNLPLVSTSSANALSPSPPPK
jgi:RHS repeat-associated protein